MEHTEDFELATSEHTLGFNGVYVGSGLELRLTLMTDVNIPEHLQKPSGVFESYATKNFSVAEAKKTFGKYELVVGDGQCVELTFPKPAKNLRFDYYQVADYTDEDAAHKGKQLKDMTEEELGFEFKAFYKRKEVVHMAAANGFSALKWGEYKGDSFTYVVFMSHLVGSLHIDKITWEDA